MYDILSLGVSSVIVQEIVTLFRGNIHPFVSKQNASCNIVLCYTNSTRDTLWYFLIKTNLLRPPYDLINTHNTKHPRYTSYDSNVHIEFAGID